VTSDFSTSEGPDARAQTPPGPRVRTDIIDIYVFRRDGESIQLLQCRRTKPPAQGTWQPVMGRIERGETAAHAALRELREETGLEPAGPGFIAMWALEGVHPYFFSAFDALVMSPRFAAEVSLSWQPTLNHEHDGARWVDARDADHCFAWPGQRLAICELLGWLRPKPGPDLARAWEALRLIPPADPGAT